MLEGRSISTTNCFKLIAIDSGRTAVQTNRITHVYGPPKSGKTTLSANIALLLAQAGLQVAIISTERPIEIRMDSIIQSDDSLSDAFLENIFSTEEYSFKGLCQLLASGLDQIESSVDLLIIDSLTATYRQVANARSLTLLRKALAALQAMAFRKQKAILFTNQVSSRMDGLNTFRPVASATVRNYSDVTLRLVKKSNGQTELSFEDVNGIEEAVLPPLTIGAKGFEEFNSVFELVTNY
ncbi:MAG: AAA family ATPase [Candidatus Heimdallarchaeota archaeon]|nr:AAA family ATPase [Candidatus Heimdallarchaeota archaeon]